MKNIIVSHAISLNHSHLNPLQTLSHLLPSRPLSLLIILPLILDIVHRPLERMYLCPQLLTLSLEFGAIELSLEVPVPPVTLHNASRNRHGAAMHRCQTRDRRYWTLRRRRTHSRRRWTYRCRCWTHNRSRWMKSRRRWTRTRRFQPSTRRHWIEPRTRWIISRTRWTIPQRRWPRRRRRWPLVRHRPILHGSQTRRFNRGQWHSDIHRRRAFWLNRLHW
jgi:hypothetical protein